MIHTNSEIIYHCVINYILEKIWLKAKMKLIYSQCVTHFSKDVWKEILELICNVGHFSILHKWNISYKCNFAMKDGKITNNFIERHIKKLILDSRSKFLLNVDAFEICLVVLSLLKASLELKKKNEVLPLRICIVESKRVG